MATYRDGVGLTIEPIDRMVDAVDTEPEEGAPPPESGAEEIAAIQRRFAIWGVAAMLVALAVVVAVSLVRTHGHLAYVIDDAAIHLSLASNLAHHATWGVVPHHYESASSSPAWTALLAAFAVVLPRSLFEYTPIAMSALAAIWLIVVLGREQTVLGTRSWQWLQMLAVATLTVGVLFVPGLTMTGMEHVLHCALVVQVVVLFGRAAEGRPLNRWAYPMLAVATMTRYETAFVAAGLALAQALPLLDATVRTQRAAWMAAARRASAISLASLGPIAAFGCVNVAMGQEVFPNAIIHKTLLARGSNNASYGLFATLTSIATDPLVMLFFAAAVVYVLVSYRRPPTRQLVYATVLVVAVPLHSGLGHYGWFERYQSYLIAVGVLFVLSMLGTVLSARSAHLVAVGVLALAVVAAPTKLHLLTDIPLASDNTYAQRYQAGLFLDRFYRGQTVATGELGYISFYHHGPLTDVFGLGDYAVLARRERGNLDAAYFEQLIRDAPCRSSWCIHSACGTRSRSRGHSSARGDSTFVRSPPSIRSCSSGRPITHARPRC